MVHPFIVAILGLLLGGIDAVTAGYKGYGTAYTGSGKLPRNACEYSTYAYGDSHFSTFFAAVDYRRWDGGSVCGKCVRVTGAKGTYLAKIVDYCAKGFCGKNDLDFSKGALKAITGYSWDYKPIEWEWADCDGPKVGEVESKTNTRVIRGQKKCGEWPQYKNLGPYIDHLTHKRDCTKVLFCKNGKRIDYDVGEEVNMNACKKYMKKKKNNRRLMGEQVEGQ